ncbi:MAG TPA: hypothetical protein VFW80_02500 [Gaiellaceae bacterium]|nr:hypothetical protein [Gaiellaceae bacterium]
MTDDLTLQRLRAANPAPPATTVDTNALFSRITNETPEALTDRAPRRRRRVLVLALAVLVLAVLASTAPAISNWIGDVIGPSEVSSEYAAAQKELTLPPGYSWPDDNFPSNSVTSRGAGGSLAVMTAMGAWECYWVKAIRDGDTREQRDAHAALLNLLANHVVVAPKGASENWAPPQASETPTAAFADDGGYEYKQRMYAAAAAGDSKLLAQSCRANGP